MYINNHLDVPIEILESIYSDTSYIEEEYSNVINNKNLNNINAFSPLNVYSNLQIDKYFNIIIKQYEIINLLFNTPNYNTFKNQLNYILTKEQSVADFLFTKSFITNIKESFKYIFTLHKCYVNNNGQLENLILKTIDNINFPVRLT
jgi:hypothetical protein